MKRAAFMTLGCKVNQYETETMEGLFKSEGYEIVPFTEIADVYIVNTCSVTSLGEKKSRQLIRRASRLNENAVIAVTGCYAQLDPKAVAEIEGVRLVVGTSGRAQIVRLVEEAAKQSETVTDVSDIMSAAEFEDIPLFDAPERTRAFLKIQEGCQNFCTFCIIPYTRGPLRSRPLASVKREAKKLIDAGFKEIVLTGIHLGAYGKDLGENITLADAAAAILENKELKRLRLGSLESVELTDGLFSLMRSDERFARHLHLPLQSGSAQILKSMNRHYTKEEFAFLLQNVERELPNVAISTDIIVGFPDETEELFEETMRFVEEQSFARLHVFPYSKRAGTPAATMDGQISEAVKHERVKKLSALGEKKAAEFREKHLNDTVEVLFETQKGEFAEGLTGNYLRVYAKGAKLGEIERVRLTDVYGDGVKGEII